MGLHTESQLVITCDTCGEMETNGGQGREFSIKVFRKSGWKIGKYCFCPNCNKQKEGREESCQPKKVKCKSCDYKYPDDPGCEPQDCQSCGISGKLSEEVMPLITRQDVIKWLVKHDINPTYYDCEEFNREAQHDADQKWNDDRISAAR